MRFDHAGIATDDAVALVDLYGGLFDAPVAHEETFGELSVTFLDLGSGYFRTAGADSGRRRTDCGVPRSEVVQASTTSPTETDDIEAALDVAREADVALIDEEPRQGAWGHDVAFLHPRRPAACSSSTSSTDADRFDEGAAKPSPTAQVFGTGF